MVQSVVEFVVGNDYRRLPRSDAHLDRTGQHYKVHDWTLYVDVLHGSHPDLLERVVFDFGSSFSPTTLFVSAYPVPVTRPDGSTAYRFATRQQTYGPVTATLKIRGTGGTVWRTQHRIVLENDNNSNESDRQIFYEKRPVRASQPLLKPLKLDDHQQFGIELELTSPPRVSLHAIAARIPHTIRVIDNYRQGREPTPSEWKMVPDASIVCSASVPDCNKFELVSPVLMGGNGLGQVSQILKAMSEIRPKLQVNKSMGFHVHVDVSALSHTQLIKVCQNWIKYEDVLDRFLPPSRRTGSVESERYFCSNRSSVNQMVAVLAGGGGYSSGSSVIHNKQRHEALAACTDIQELVNAMNCDGRYYKLNLQNLASGRQPTIEFRQHSATMNYEKVSSWVRFCVAFVTHSAKLAAPKPFASHRSLEYQFDALFHYVIKDRALRNFYKNRFDHWSGVHNNNGDDDDDDDYDDNEPCCSGCAKGGVCATKRHRAL